VCGLVCEYENRFGDRYRVVVPVEADGGRLEINGHEELYITQQASVAGGAPEWVHVA
jgi:hypothetical protein